MRQRAAQFSPFAALVGYENVVHEMERQTTPERELSEDEKAELDRRIAIISALLSNNPIVTVEYFVPDSRKDGGEYRVKTVRSRGSRRRGAWSWLAANLSA